LPVRDLASERPMTDRSNGYEGVAAEFLAKRGRAASTAIGMGRVRDWARALPPAASVVDLGCGSGFPITKVLVDEGLDVYGIDAAPSLVEAFRHNLPDVPVACESVLDSSFFKRTFQGVIAWGLMFLLQPHEQRLLIRRAANVLVRGGGLLFTAAAEPATWNDVMTGLESRSLGAPEYRRQLSFVGLSVINEYEDEGQNYYFDSRKSAGQISARPPESDHRIPR
jgi:SAM-dependent methyltransferase